MNVTKVMALLGVALAVLLGFQAFRIHRLKRGTLREEDLVEAAAQTARSNGRASPGVGAADNGIDDSLDAFEDWLVGNAEEAMLAREEGGAQALADVRAQKDRNGGGVIYGENAGDRGSATPGSRKRAGSNPGRNDGPKEEKEDANKGNEARKGRSRDLSHRLLANARQGIEAGEYENALELLDQSIEADPLNGQAYRTLANLYRALGMTEEERQVYYDWMEASPRNSLPHYYLASTYQRLGMSGEALGELIQFLDVSAGDPTSYPLAASLYRRLGMPEEEGGILQTWVDGAPESAQAHGALASYYRRNRDYPAALNEYQIVLGLAPGNVGGHVGLATVYQQMGYHAEAQAEYLTALELRPGDLGVRMRLAESYRRGGDPVAAIQTYQSVIDNAPGSNSARRAGREINRIQRQQTKPPKPRG